MAIQVVNDTQLGTSPDKGIVDRLPKDAKFLKDNLQVKAFVSKNIPPAWFSPGYLEAEYALYVIETTFQTDMGLQAAPATAPSGNSTSPTENTIIRVRQPFTLKVITWSAVRQFVKPVLPHWDTGNKNEKCIDRQIIIRTPQQSMNQKTWEASGRYVYAFKKEPFVTVGQTQYFILPATMTPAENIANGLALHAYDQGDFSFTPLNTAWIPVNWPNEEGGKLPIGFRNRVPVPDSPKTASGGGNQPMGAS